jgi:hypothetical protein
MCLRRLPGKRYPIKRSRSLRLLILSTSAVAFDHCYISKDWIRIIPIRNLPSGSGYQIKMGGLFDHYHNPDVWWSP